MKLKTLKDLECDLEWKYDTLIALKKEAIKWIKELEKIEDGIVNCNGLQIFNIPYEQDDPHAIIKWIMCFFNITKEDLK